MLPISNQSCNVSVENLASAFTEKNVCMPLNYIRNISEFPRNKKCKHKQQDTFPPIK